MSSQAERQSQGSSRPDHHRSPGPSVQGLAVVRPFRRIEVASRRSELPARPGGWTLLPVAGGGTAPIETREASVGTRQAGAHGEGPERLLLTLVFTDMVASTATLERVGDSAWCALLSHHRSLVREHLSAAGGREVDAAGDGFFLVFDRPSRAVRFAVAVIPALQAIGIDIRIGIHTGECEVAGARVEGVAVHTAARVANAAGAGEILVSNTVRDVVAGSSWRFTTKDRCVLKGLAAPRELFALQCPRSSEPDAQKYSDVEFVI